MNVLLIKKYIIITSESFVTLALPSRCSDFSSAARERIPLFWLVILPPLLVNSALWLAMSAASWQILPPLIRAGRALCVCVCAQWHHWWPVHDGGSSGGAGRRSRFFSRFLSRFLPAAGGGVLGAGGGGSVAACRLVGAAAAADWLR